MAGGDRRKELCLDWIPKILEGSEAQNVGKKVMEDMDCFVQNGTRYNQFMYPCFFGQYTFDNVCERGVCIWCWVIIGVVPQQDLAHNVELKAMICASKACVVWPKIHDGEAGESLAEKMKNTKHGKHPKVTILSLKLNVKIMEPFVGWSTLYKKIGHVDFLTYALQTVNDFWEVPFIKKIPGAFPKESVEVAIAGSCA